MINRSQLTGVLVVLLLTTLAWEVSVLCDEPDLHQTHYYVISIGGITSTLDSLIATAKGEELPVIVVSDGVVSTYRGSQATEEPEAALLESGSLLYVDHNWFLLQMAGEEVDYVVRPAEVGYALVLIPHRDLAEGEALLRVLGDLQQLGIVGAEVQMEWVGAFPKEAEKDPKPPEGVAIDSALYRLTVSADWFSTAASLGLARVGLRVEVVAEKIPGAAIPAAFQTYIVSETEELAKLLVPIHRLVELARLSVIGYLRPPYQPQPAAP